MDPSNAILLIGHPGHELRLHRWLELVRPMVFVLDILLKVFKSRVVGLPPRFARRKKKKLEGR